MFHILTFYGWMNVIKGSIPGSYWLWINNNLPLENEYSAISSSFGACVSPAAILFAATFFL